ncbi:palmitoyltransferase, putative [Plasmopara halstedii]|uniref:Palmitoyltransferase, putative n=1 Tax=Plasmopara halstedii TaxID=4781 RepID=A0A0P1B5G9_PLAHL|nr:palmitoyltransferase, putative [Plasmopara halstedii]CEG49298.1 palmitoyltransferase, putative [Plasmopara halstedii]|eukprot:XP_024585667.1 palmitoyltransferase, putative [Plasmopara halstedii]
MVVKLVKDTNYNNFNALLWFSRIMSLGIGLLLGGYFAFHVWLLREGKTTLEFLAGKRGELANHTFLYNVTVYFGNNVKSWWVPTTPQLPDALSNKEVEDDDKDTVRFVVI